ncbi:MAG: formylglycine-generating enzyme family protein [Candidatus Sumerlaeaceae bacterium]|nr:formylglycine-generating enzyme family protein [Candidatus Sumerlaeaceae bacterium]
MNYKMNDDGPGHPTAETPGKGALAFPFLRLPFRLGAALVAASVALITSPVSGQTTETQAASFTTSASVGPAKPPEKPWPSGMLWIPGGEFSMGGVGPEARPDEFPVHRVRVSPFWMDETEVTNDQFAKFAEATGYVTVAEKKPDWEELKKQLPPGTAKPDDSMLQAGSMVFKPTAGPVPLTNPAQWWDWVIGASWRHPLGPGTDISGKGNYPVVHVCYDDALAYSKWAGKRLPTEAEWEFACRGGEEGKRFTWGEDEPSDTNIKANVWQGKFPYEKKPVDGYFMTAPVRSFPPNRYGLYDMIGNVWEWNADWYRHDYYKKLADTGKVAVDPPGPTDSYDPEEPYTPKRINRGGSFLCNSQYCASYRPSARMKTSPDTGQIHLGFRCVMSDADWRKKNATK